MAFLVVVEGLSTGRLPRGEIRHFFTSPWVGSKTLITPSETSFPEDRVTHLIWGWGTRLSSQLQKRQRRLKGATHRVAFS